MTDPEIVTREQWRAARLELLAEEKELTKHRDRVNEARRRLPMVEVTEDYRFQGPEGELTLLDLFDGRRQLLVHHVMFGPEADAACPSCSFWQDCVGNLTHLHARSTTLVAVSRAPLPKLQAYRERMGWHVPWYSSHGSMFNYDYHASFDASIAPVEWNYRGYEELVRMNPGWENWSGEEQGVSAFLRQGDRVFHTYSCYGRGDDLLNTTYNWLDLTALGRQEGWEKPEGRGSGPFMGWLRRHDEYDPEVIAGARDRA